MVVGLKTQTSAARAIPVLLPPSVAVCAHGTTAVSAFGRGAPLCPRPQGPKATAPVSLAGFEPPAAAADPRFGSQKPEPVSNHHDHPKTYVPAACGVRGFVFNPTRYRKPESEKRTSESRKPAERLSRRMALAGFAAVSVAWPAAAAEPDPIFAAIERHRELSDDYTAAVDVSSELEDGPEFEAANAIAGDTCRALLDHADALIRLQPTTIAGVVALLRYVATLEEWEQPRSFEVDGEPVWIKTLCTTVANALDRTGGVVA